MTDADKKLEEYKNRRDGLKLIIERQEQAVKDWLWWKHCRMMDAKRRMAAAQREYEEVSEELGALYNKSAKELATIMHDQRITGDAE